jgi:hypothetical protein
VAKNREQALELIDLVAEAMEEHEEQNARYMAGRDTILAFYEENPKATFAVAQAGKYLLVSIGHKAKT